MMKHASEGRHHQKFNTRNGDTSGPTKWTGVLRKNRNKKQKKKRKKEKDGNVNSFEEFYAGMQKFISEDVIAS